MRRVIGLILLFTILNGCSSKTEDDVTEGNYYNLVGQCYVSISKDEPIARGNYYKYLEAMDNDLKSEVAYLESENLIVFNESESKPSFPVFIDNEDEVVVLKFETKQGESKYVDENGFSYFATSFDCVEEEVQ